MVSMKFALTDTVDEIARELGKRVAAHRLAMNWSQQELASRSGVSKRSIERLEQGTGNPNLKVFISVCSTLRRIPEFESLLPEVELTPQQVFARQKLRKRARRPTNGGGTVKWGTDE